MGKIFWSMDILFCSYLPLSISVWWEITEYFKLSSIWKKNVLKSIFSNQFLFILIIEIHYPEEYRKNHALDSAM